MIWTLDMKNSFHSLFKNNKTIKHLILSPVLGYGAESFRRDVNNPSKRLFRLPGPLTVNPNLNHSDRYFFDSDDSDSDDGWCSGCGEYHGGEDSDLESDYYQDSEEEEELINENYKKEKAKRDEKLNRIRKERKEKEELQSSLPNLDYLRENDSLEILEFRKSL